MRILSRLNQLLEVPSMDPDDARRRKLLNILLIGLATTVVLALLANIFSDIANLYPQEQINLFYLITTVALIGFIAIFAVNRYGSGRLASTLFLLVVTVGATFADDPREVAVGRSLVSFVIPIMMASVLLRPYASFILAGLSSLAITAVALSIEEIPNLYAMTAFLITALVAWLAARSLEHALVDLRILNVELDQRVEQRTGELKAILDSTADGIIVFDNAGQATIANPALGGLLGQPAGGVVGHHIEELMTGDIIDAKDQELVTGLLEGSRETELPSVKFGWGRKTLSMSVAPVQLESGEGIGTVAVFRDFTREAEVDRMKSTFVSIASHELRTPLNAIMGYTEMLQEGVYGDLTDQQRGATERLMANTSHMLGLVNNLLDRARIEAGTLTLNLAPFSPSKLVDGVIGVMSMMAHNKGLKLTRHIAADVPETLEGDWQRLHQILINLTSNAIKFTEEGGIDVHICVANKNHWAMVVADTGIGIPEDAQEYIFDPFRQVDSSATREYGGAGLGLSIVNQLVGMMGGRIELESEIGKGSTFTVILPMAQPGAEGAETEGG